MTFVEWRSTELALYPTPLPAPPSSCKPPFWPWPSPLDPRVHSQLGILTIQTVCRLDGIPYNGAGSPISESLGLESHLLPCILKFQRLRPTPQEVLWSPSHSSEGEGNVLHFSSRVDSQQQSPSGGLSPSRSLA